MTPKQSAGFSLVEIMFALAILSFSIMAVYTAVGNSLRASGRSENVRMASMLARQKMAEKMIELQKDLDKGKFPDDQVNDQGNFEPPLDRYRWEFAVRKVEIPVVELPGQEGAEATGGGPSTSTGTEPGAANQAPAAAQENLAKLVTKKISESVREITLKVIWEELETEQSLSITTHIAKLQ